MLYELPFYDERNHKVEITDSKDPLVQLDASKTSIKNLFKDLLDEIKGFKYQIIVKLFLSKYKENTGTEHALVYFNSITKAVIDFEYDLDKSFHKILYRIDNWIREGFGWLNEYIDAEYANISIYNALSKS